MERGDLLYCMSLINKFKNENPGYDINTYENNLTKIISAGIIDNYEPSPDDCTDTIVKLYNKDDNVVISLISSEFYVKKGDKRVMLDIVYPNENSYTEIKNIDRDLFVHIFNNKILKNG